MKAHMQRREADRMTWCARRQNSSAALGEVSE